jgi:hypothetical protein
MSEKSVILAIRPQSSRRQALTRSGVWKTLSADSLLSNQAIPTPSNGSFSLRAKLRS